MENAAETKSNTQGPGLGSKVKTNKTPILIIALAILTGLLMVVALSPKAQAPVKSNPAANSTPTAPAEAVLSFANATSSGSLDSVDVVASTGNATATGFQLELSFDPKLISNIEITPGSFVKGWQVLPLSDTDYKNGRISYAVGVPLGGNGVKGRGAIAHISFTEIGLKGQVMSIKVLPKTMVSAQGFAGSFLKSSSNYTKVIGETTSTPSAQAAPKK